MRPSIVTVFSLVLVVAGCGSTDSTTSASTGTVASASGGESTRSTVSTETTSTVPASTVTSSDVTVGASVGPETIRPVQQQASMGFDQEHPVGRCGPRDSYYYVSTEFRCADGSNPLNGDLRAGQASRVGNVGENASGHIIDLYEVPCSGGAQRVFVDMYICPPGVSPFDGLGR